MYSGYSGFRLTPLENLPSLTLEHKSIQKIRCERGSNDLERHDCAKGSLTQYGPLPGRVYELRNIIKGKKRTTGDTNAVQGIGSDHS